MSRLHMEDIWITLHALAESIQAFLVCLHFFRWRHTQTHIDPVQVHQGSARIIFLPSSWDMRWTITLHLPDVCRSGIRTRVSVSETCELPSDTFPELFSPRTTRGIVATDLYLYQVITYQRLPAQSLPWWSLSIFLALVESRSMKITTSASQIFLCFLFVALHAVQIAYPCLHLHLCKP